MPPISSGTERRYDSRAKETQRWRGGDGRMQLLARRALRAGAGAATTSSSGLERRVRQSPARCSLGLNLSAVRQVKQLRNGHTSAYDLRARVRA